MNPRVAVADDGRQIIMKVYYGNTAFDVVLSPVRALTLAHSLTEAAIPKLMQAMRSDDNP